MVDIQLKDYMYLQRKILKQSQIIFGKWPPLLNSDAIIRVSVCWKCVNVLIRSD